MTGTFQHPVSRGDRLDQLAYTYYGQPLQWWHIADANPAFLSPLALLGARAGDHHPASRDRTASGTPSWADLLRGLSAMAGVEHVGIEDEVQYVAEASAQSAASKSRVTVEQPGERGPGDITTD